MLATPTGLIRAFGGRGLRQDLALAGFTTFGIGGPADWFVEVETTGDLVQAIRSARLDGLPVMLLGGGSNILVSDRGVRGLVVRARTRLIVSRATGSVDADAGVTMNGLVRWTILQGLGGLEAWAGTPGTVGGAVCGNAHYAGRPVSEVIEGVTVLSTDGAVTAVEAREMAFGYDASRLQQSGEVLLTATFRLIPGQDPERLRATARASLLHRKQTQPLHLPSAGCIFQNPIPGRDEVPPGMPWSAGALVDAAGLKGAECGRARVSPVHANFIVNQGGATASDVRALIERCRREVHRQFGVVLREEIVYAGEW